MNILKKVKLSLTKLFEKNSNFAFYVLIGGFATIIDFSVLYSLTEYFNVNYFYSAAIAYCFGMLTNFYLNKKYNFKNKSKKIVHQAGLFFIIASIGLAINQFVIWFLVSVFGVWYITAKLVSVIVVLFWSFNGHKRFTFHYFK